MSPSPSPQYSLSEADSNVEGGTPRSGSKPPIGSRTVRRSTGNLATILESRGVRTNKRPSPSAGKASEDNSAEEKNNSTPNTIPGENNKKIIVRPKKRRPPFDPFSLGTSATGGSVKSVRGIQGKTFNNVGNLGLLTKDRLITEILKRQQPPAPSSSSYARDLRTRVERALERARAMKNQLRTYTKFQLIAELTARLPNEEKKALNARKQKAIEEKKLKEEGHVRVRRRVADDAENKRKAQKAAADASAAMGAGFGAAAVETAKRSMNTEMEEYKGQMQLTVKKIQNRERAKTAAAIANANKRVEEQAEALDTAIRKYEEYIEKLKKGGKNLSAAMVKKNEKLALMKAEKNKQLVLATKKLDELATKFAKRDNNFSKKNILDFISKRAKSNNRLTKRDILEFLSKQKTPTVTVKQSIGNVKAEGGKSNVKIENSKKLNREALLAQNIKQRDANYRRVVAADPLALKRQKRVFAKRRGELLKSIQKIIKSDRKASPTIKKKVYESYSKSPRSRISKLLKLPRRDLISMIKRSTSRTSK